MLQEQTECTKLGPRYDVFGVSTIEDPNYLNDQEMEDTVSSPVQIIGKTVLEMDVSLLGLTLTIPLSVEYLHEVTGPSTVATRNLGDAGSILIESLISGMNVAETTASKS